MRKPGFVDRCWQIALFFAYRLLLVYWFIFRPKTLGSVVVVWCGENVLLVRNSYKPVYSFPGGGRTAAEESAKAGVRELFEETGIKVDSKDVRFAMNAFSKSEWKHDSCDFFELHLDVEPEVQIDQREIVFMAFVDFDELENYPMTHNAEQYVAWKQEECASNASQ